MEYSWFLVVIHKHLSRVAQQGRSLPQGGSWGPCSHRLTVEPWLLPELNSTANEMPSSSSLPSPSPLWLDSCELDRTHRADIHSAFSTHPRPCPGHLFTSSSWSKRGRGARGGVCFSPQKAKRMSASQSNPSSSIKLDQQNTLSGSPKLIDLVDQSNLFPP